MLVLEHIRQLIHLAHPKDADEYKRFFAQIKPVQYGNLINFPVDPVVDYTLATYQIPHEIHHVILRVESKMINWTVGAADFGQTEETYDGNGFWTYTPYGVGGSSQQVEPSVPIQCITEIDPFLVFAGGYNISLIANFLTAPADGFVRRIRTLVYAYNVGTEVVDRSGIAQSVVAPSSVAIFI